MAGTISLSLSQQFDELGEPLAGGKLYFYRAGTTSTPQNAFFDADLTLPFPNPYTLDAAGRIPQFFLADGSIKVKLIDRHGTEQISADNVLVIGPSGGGGGGGSVDPTTVWRTGDLKPRYDTGPHDGFVRANGRSIGSSTSGATELAGPTAQSLFILLYADPNLVVSGGRGGLSAIDAWTANKNIATPDLRGRAPVGLDDMGNSAASRLTAAYFGALATVLGATGGGESTTLTLGQLPTGITVSGSNQIRPGGFDFPVSGGTITGALVTATGVVTAPATSTNWVSSLNLTTTIAATSNNTSGSPHRTVQPSLAVTFYIKL